MGKHYSGLARSLNFENSYKTMLVSSTIPLGEYVEYNHAPKSRLDYIKKWIPSELNYQEFTKVFKKDIAVDSIVERLYDVKVFYIETMQGRGDELYYFSRNNHLFHGERVWSQYHPFLSQLQRILPSAEVVDPAWFVGSRSNYTHQLIDFLPNLIYRGIKGPNQPWESCFNVFGASNNILDSVSEVPFLAKELNRPRLFLKELGEPVSYGPWQIRCIKFRDLFLVRHLSIYKAFSLLQAAFNINGLRTYRKSSDEKKSVLYLSRSDKRVLNQKQIEDYLELNFQATIVNDIHTYSYAEKKNVLSDYHRIIMPPGSDNINALCFSNADCALFQMIPGSADKLLESPFTSYAGLRYLLPFLHRLVLIPSEQTISPGEANSGMWALNSFRLAIDGNSE